MNDIAFVSMPFGDDPESPDNEWTKLYEHGLRPLEEPLPDVPDHKPIVLWRADRTLSALGLKENVIKLIERSTYVLCVLTTAVVDGSNGLRLSNPNVLWELGYAEAIGKPIVVLADNEDLRRLPVLAGKPNVCVYNHDDVQKATSQQAPVALCKIPRNLAPYVRQAGIDARRGRLPGQRGRAVVLPNRDALDLAAMISTAEQEVDILTTNLNYFASRRFQNRPSPFETALGNGATVRVVTMDPESVIAEYRARQLKRGQDIPGYRKELRDGIIWFHRNFGAHSRFHLHVYNDLPLQITIRIDDTIITSIVTRGERARKRIQVQFSLYDEGVTDSFVTHFQSMFEDSSDVKGIAWVIHESNGRDSEETWRGGPAPGPTELGQQLGQHRTAASGTRDE